MKQVITFFIVLLCISLVVAVVRLALTGHFDHGEFQILSSTANGRDVALLVKRSDHDSMSSDQVFVLLDNHIPSSVELRRAFHSETPVFSAGGDRLRLAWDGPRRLKIMCDHCDIQRNYVAQQKYRDGSVSIDYEGFPISFYR